MSYIINKTDGSILTEIIDGSIDQVSTDLTLLGKNSSSYGEYWNENFLHLLENFSNSITPNHPIVGQLWYDTSENRLKVYDGFGFKVTSGTIVSATAPSSLAKGDVWIDSKRQQLYFNDGVSTILAGPSYSKDQGISGLVVGDVIDTNNQTHTVVYLYAGGMLIGIFSNSSFTPAASIVGYTVDTTASNVLGTTAPTADTESLVLVDKVDNLSIGQAVRVADSISSLSTINTYYIRTINTNPRSVTLSTVDSNDAVVLTTTTLQTSLKLVDISNDILVGFNSSSLKNSKLHATATMAEALVDSQGHVKKADSFVSTQFGSTITGSLTIANVTPLYLGVTSQSEIQITNQEFAIKSNVSNQNITFNVKRGIIDDVAIKVSANDKKVLVYPSLDTPTALLDVNGSVNIQGNLTVQGSVTTVSSTTLEISDKLIEIGKTTTPTDVLATGGGISLAGDTVKTITWSAANGWTSSESVNLTSGHSYKINGVDVLTYNTLAASVTHAPGLTSIGALAELQMGKINITNNTIGYVNIIDTDGDITLIPKGAGVVSVDNSRISNLADPTQQTDAVNYQFLRNTVHGAPLGLSMDITGLSEAQIVTYVTAVYPPMVSSAEEHAPGAICRVLCVNAGSRSLKKYVLSDTHEWQIQSTQNL